MPTKQPSAINEPSIDRPVCERCGSRMWLLKISPDGVGMEMRTFQCPVCEVSTGDRTVDLKSD